MIAPLRWTAIAGAVLLLATVLTHASLAQPATHHSNLRIFGVGKDVYVRALAVDRRDKSLWIGTSLGAINIDLATEDMKHTFTRDDGLANEYVFSLGVAPTGEIWFGTNAGGASTYKQGKWRTYFPMHGLADYWVYAFAFDGAGAWIGTWDGASYFDSRTGKFKTYRDELVNIWVYGIDIDAAGRVWFGTEGGVSMYDKGKWRSWTHEDGLGAANIRGLEQSSNTGLGTRSRHDLGIDVGGRESYNPNYVFSVTVDNDGRHIWFGTWGGGVSVFDGESGWKSYSDADGLAGNVVYSIAQEKGGALWFGTNRGVSRFDGKNWTTIRKGLPSPHIYAIAIDDNGTVWLGTRGAVVSLRTDGESK